MYFGFADCLGTNDHFRPVLNPAPPRPRKPEFLTTLMIASGCHPKRFLDGFVAVELQVAIDIRRTFAKALGDDLYFVGMGNQISHLIDCRFLILDCRLKTVDFQSAIEITI